MEYDDLHKLKDIFTMNIKSALKEKDLKEEQNLFSSWRSIIRYKNRHKYPFGSQIKEEGQQVYRMDSNIWLNMSDLRYPGMASNPAVVPSNLPRSIKIATH